MMTGINRNINSSPLTDHRATIHTDLNEVQPTRGTSTKSCSFVDSRASLRPTFASPEPVIFDAAMSDMADDGNTNSRSTTPSLDTTTRDPTPAMSDVSTVPELEKLVVGATLSPVDVDAVLLSPGDSSRNCDSSKKRKLQDDVEVVILDDGGDGEDLGRRKVETELYKAMLSTRSVGFISSHGPIMSLATQSRPIMLKLKDKTFWISSVLLAEGSDMFKVLLSKMDLEPHPTFSFSLDQLDLRFATAHFESFVDFIHNMSLWRPPIRLDKISLVFLYIAAKELKAIRWATILLQWFNEAVTKTTSGTDLGVMVELVHVIYGPIPHQVPEDPVRTLIFRLIVKHMPVLKKKGFYAQAVERYPALRDEIIDHMFGGESQVAAAQEQYLKKGAGELSHVFEPTPSAVVKSEH